MNGSSTRRCARCRGGRRRRCRSRARASAANGSPQARCVPLMPWISSSGSPVAAALVKEATAADGEVRHAADATRRRRARAGPAGSRAASRRRLSSTPSKPATRTPSSRTGRGGAYSRRSSSATAMIVASSLMSASIDRARVTVVQSSRRTLIAIVRPRVSCALQPLGQPLGLAGAGSTPARRGRRRRRRRSSRRERDFATRAGDQRRLVVQSGRGGAGHGRSARRSAPAAASTRRVLQCAERGVAHLGQPRRGLRPDARHDPRRAVGDAGGACSRPIATKPAGFSASEATLATSRLGAIPAEIWMPVCSLDLGDQRAQDAQRLVDAGQVDVGLVDPGLLDDLDALAHQTPDLSGLLGVGLVVGRDRDRLRDSAAAPRPRSSPSRRRTCAPRSDAVVTTARGPLPATITGSPRSSGRRCSSTDAKNASQSRWAMTRFATSHRLRRDADDADARRRGHLAQATPGCRRRTCRPCRPAVFIGSPLV